jgi:hypothetical protein
MNYFSQFLFLLIEIKQQTILNWLGIEDPRIATLNDVVSYFVDPSLDNIDIDLSTLEPSPNVSIETFRIILDTVWQRLSNGGLSLTDIENIILFMAFIRFIILVLRFNLRTGFLITCVGVAAAYVWYLHLSEILYGYLNLLFKMPFMTTIAFDLMDLRESKMAARGENFSLRYPVRLLWRSFANGSQLNGHYIDPISMIFARFSEEVKIYTDRFYYLLYQDVGPGVLQLCRKIYHDIGPLARYTFIVRIGKKYCPYLVRWHWTFLMLLQVTERFLIFLIYRISLYNTRVLIPKYRMIDITISTNQLYANKLGDEINILYYIAFVLIGYHIAFIIYALLQALWGQYFYVPFYTENVELHLGEVPNSPYVGGNMPWRDPKVVRHKYSDSIRNIPYNIRIFIKKLIKMLFKIFKKIFKK